MRKGHVGGGIGTLIAFGILLREVSLLCQASACHAHADLTVITANALRGECDEVGFADNRQTVRTLAEVPLCWLLDRDTAGMVASDRDFHQFAGGRSLAEVVGRQRVPGENDLLAALLMPTAEADVERARGLQREYLDRTWVVKWFVK